ncbi:DUF3710 domain-containing protein [Ruania suaedae]|uniref:DUF3710 domain-containing protein n=1 Tax=Ruania suaedae TaxID=2897774 RepID=UPI001E463F91|nr:DUF3710 domain-containing protein [Ruania suaedae]UFU01611.1 DUF3710 domain-containing protein [Ruania suaedae]
MAWLRRRRAAGTEDASPIEEPATPETEQADEAVAEGLIGPWDSTEVRSRGQRLDLGSLWVPKRAGMQVRMELDRKTRRVVGVNLALEGSSLQIQPFAAPRTAGLWDTLRAELETQVGKQGGSVDERPGPFGAELLARLPVRLPDGRSGHRPARFLGVDGPRWFLRGVLTGRAAIDATAAGTMEEIFGDVVVVRGEDPRPPRDLLPLHLPGQRTPAAQDQPAGIEVPARGPEITETR